MIDWFWKAREIGIAFFVSKNAEGKIEHTTNWLSTSYCLLVILGLLGIYVLVAHKKEDTRLKKKRIIALANKQNEDAKEIERELKEKISPLGRVVLWFLITAFLSFVLPGVAVLILELSPVLITLTAMGLTIWGISKLISSDDEKAMKELLTEESSEGIYLTVDNEEVRKLAEKIVYSKKR